MTLGLLGETAIDFTQGNESSAGRRTAKFSLANALPDFGESIAQMLDIVEPVADERERHT